jgi:GNAT superfamily N-acetyltransferase
MEIVRVADGPQLEQVRALFEEYWRAFGFAPCFQGFEEELASLPGSYTLFLAPSAGCVAVRPLSDDTAEMKRLFVRPQARGTGLGRQLAMAVIEHARAAGFSRLVLDTIAEKMGEAVALYRSLGFHETAPYSDTPGALFMEMVLR